MSLQKLPPISSYQEKACKCQKFGSQYYYKRRWNLQTGSYMLVLCASVMVKYPNKKCVKQSKAKL